MRPRRLRAAADLWRALTNSRGVEARDTLWSHPDLLPSSADLDDPAGFVDRDNAFAELLAGFEDVDTSGLDTAPGEDSTKPTDESDDKPDDQPKPV
jgi:hypothetical protein